ncbi:FecR family protein [Porticoccaceae bacterium LTM1]|nr:FecR family protein [Porticoccaceae bacterium LTM1]
MTDNVYDMTEYNRIREEASLWLARLDGEDADSKLHREFEHWLSRDSRHRSVFSELGDVWGEMDILALFQPLLTTTSELDSTSIPAQTRPSRANRTWLSFAAAALVVMAIGLLYPTSWQQQAEPLVYTTSIGEQRTVELDDGSTIQLNTNSVVEVAYSNDIRQLRLLRGEAYFDVAHNKNRPFVVQAGSGNVEAVGTAFAIQLEQSSVEVAVTEGRVKVTPLAAQPSPTPPMEKPLAYADAGQIVTYNKGIESIQTASNDQLERFLSWRTGQLRFQGETLEEAISEFSRYTDIRIILSEPAVRELRVGGVFKTGDINEFLNVLEEGFQVEVKRHSPKLVYLKMTQK